LFSCDADRTAARARIAARTAQFLGVHGAAPITALGGVPAAAAAEFRRRLLAGEDAAPLVTDAMLDSLTVSGTPDDCTAAIARFAEAGVDSLILSDDGAQDPVSTLNSIAAIARRSGYVPAPLSSRRRLPTAPRLGPLEWTYVLPHERARPGARKRSCAYARR
jgi:alkanesulfonate monooxygenase SsuD/methylene tetrahydromethanopterin reductase-like flavin-dependent oxidoreductase (luciferase family)